MYYYLYIISFLIALNVSFLGIFLLLNKELMVGDALANSMLVAIWLTFSIFHNLSPWGLLGSSLLVGNLVLIIFYMTKNSGDLSSDASLALTSSFFFSLGTVAIGSLSQKIDLDIECVFLGKIVFAPFYLYDCAGFLIPRAIIELIALTVLNMLFLFFCFPTLKIIIFDPIFAQFLGVSVQRWRMAFISMVSITAVICLRIGGLILFTAFLSIPPAIAYLLSHCFTPLFIQMLIVNILAIYFGISFAIRWKISVEGSIVLVLSWFFLATLCSFIFQSVKKKKY